MSEDDEYGFWDSDRGRAPRHVGRRAHHSVEVEDGWSATRHSGPRTMNPLWPRLGAMVAIGVLALPVALMMRSSGDAGHLTSSESPTSDAALIEPSSPAIVAPTSSAAPTTSVAVAATGASFAASAAVSQSPSVAPTTVAVARVETAADVESSAPSSVARAASAPPVAEKQSVLNRSCRKSYEVIDGYANRRRGPIDLIPLRA